MKELSDLDKRKKYITLKEGDYLQRGDVWNSKEGLVPIPYCMERRRITTMHIRDVYLRPLVDPKPDPGVYVPSERKLEI